MNADDVELTVNGQKVRCRLFRPVDAPQKLALLFLHGWTGRPNENAASFMAEKGFYSLTVIMRGHPGSDGDIKTITAKDSLADAITAFDYLKDQIPAGTGVAVVGNSYGGYIAALLSRDRGLAAISIRVPAAYPDASFELPKWGSGHDDPVVDAWRKQKTSFAENIAFTAVHDFKGQIQIIEAEQDEIVPRQTVANYVEAVSDPTRLDYELMAGWPHSIGKNVKIQEKFKDVLLKWAAKVAVEV